MKKRTSLLVGIVLTGIVLACSNSKNVIDEDMDIANFNLGDTTNIELGDIVLCSDDLDLFVQFDSLVTDSRCPKGANCIWEGNAAVALSVTYAKELEPITLNTDEKLGRVKKAFGFSIELIAVNPYPGTPNSENTIPNIDILVNKAE